MDSDNNPITLFSLTPNLREWMEKALCENNGLTSLRPFHLDHAMDLNEKKDLFLVIATGMGVELLHPD
jgi:hypothetical protein